MALSVIFPHLSSENVVTVRKDTSTKPPSCKILPKTADTVLLNAGEIPANSGTLVSTKIHPPEIF